MWQCLVAAKWMLLPLNRGYAVQIAEVPSTPDDSYPASFAHFYYLPGPERF